MNWLEFLKYLFVMAGVTYLIRVLPYVFMRKEVKNRFFKSFLLYVHFEIVTVKLVVSLPRAAVTV